MSLFKNFLNELNIKNNLLNSTENLCTFHLSKIDYKNGYNKELLNQININFQNFKQFSSLIDLNNNYENAFFNLNTEVDYDNKINGGRILFKLYNHQNNYEADFVENTFLNKILSEKKLNIKFFERGYFQLCLLILIKNNFKKHNDEKLFKENNILYYINSFEGVILQKDDKNIKMIIHLDKDFTENELKEIINLIKNLINVKEKKTFRYAPFGKNDKINYVKEFYY